MLNFIEVKEEGRGSTDQGGGKARKIGKRSIRITHTHTHTHMHTHTHTHAHAHTHTYRKHMGQT